MLSNHFITNFSQNVPVKKFWKSVTIWQRYGQKFLAYFCGPPCTFVYIDLVTSGSFWICTWQSFTHETCESPSYSGLVNAMWTRHDGVQSGPVDRIKRCTPSVRPSVCPCPSIPCLRFSPFIMRYDMIIDEYVIIALYNCWRIWC